MKNTKIYVGNQLFSPVIRINFETVLIKEHSSVIIINEYKSVKTMYCSFDLTYDFIIRLQFSKKN